MTVKKRIFYIAASLILTAVFICCAVGVIAESGHDCTGESCRVCAQITACISVLKIAAASAAAVIAAAFSVKFFILLKSFNNVSDRFDTQISLKNRIIS